MKSFSEDDRMRAYLQHRQRVKNATPKIDNRPPNLYVSNFCRFSKLKDDINTHLRVDKCNTRLIVAINALARNRGVVDAFRTKENFTQANFSKKSQALQLLEKIECENMKLGKRILCTKSDLNTRISPRFIRKKKAEAQVAPFQYSNQVLSKYCYDNIPKEPKLAKKFLRPKIWFQMEVKGGRPLGRIAIELYTEAAPQIVLEFVRLCFNKQKERINLLRLFPCLWLEGEISLDSQTLLQKNIEYDKRILDHGQHAAVLSFGLENINLFQKGILNFTISFKPLSVLNGKRVGFGRVCRGLKVLNCIQDYGTKNGKPIREIIVSDCGIFS